MAERIYSVDAMRIVAMVPIVLIHTDPFQGYSLYGNMFNFATKTTARFAVPFFFLTAGYFFALKTTSRDPTRYFVARAKRITSLYVFGLALAAPVFFIGALVRARLSGRNVVDSALGTLAGFLSPVELLYYGTSVSEILWFLPALLFSFAFVYAFVRTNRTALLLPAALCLHAVGLLGASYTMFVDVPFEIRDALFFGVFYTSLGYTVYARDWRPTAEASGRYLVLTVCFALAQLGELSLLGYVVPGEPFGQSVYAPSYAITTALLSLSLFLFLLSRPDLGSSTRLPRWGKYAVGIYVTHPAVLYVLQGVHDALTAAGYAVGETVAWHLALTPATFFGALAVYLTAHELGIIDIDGSHVPRVPRLRNAGSE
ncbi:acyltransferase family protein [Halorientalis salina]|uniref:acyltransferase family protein n=1 Tax=Halorientalis salina TaxID=2932266 RepID=UPI0010ABBED4|nr:acyltransferase [Halorientalis salina]